MYTRRGKALVVDDEASIRQLLKRALESASYTVSLAPGGKEALEAASRESFDLVLLDIRMPGLSGIDVLRTLLDKTSDISVIMVTGVIDVTTAVEAMRMGAHDYVMKPFDLDDLLVRIEKAQERRRLQLMVKEYQRVLEARVGEQGKQGKQLRENTVRTIQDIIQEDAEGQPPEARN